MDDLLTIGEVADRAGVATSALRFYEDRGLLTSTRTEGNQRRYPRNVLRHTVLPVLEQTPHSRIRIFLSEQFRLFRPLQVRQNLDWEDLQPVLASPTDATP